MKMGYKRALKAISLEETEIFPQMEFMAHPEFELVATGIDPYEHPRKSAVTLIKKFELDLAFPPVRDDPIPRKMRIRNRK